MSVRASFSQPWADTAAVTFARCCRSLLLAGQETTASSLTWFLWEIARHPESQKRIREEISAVYSRRVNGEDLSIADLDRMTYTQAALKVLLLSSLATGFCLPQSLIDIFVGSGVVTSAPHHLDAWKSGGSG